MKKITTYNDILLTWIQMAAGSLAGHLIECGTQVGMDLISIKTPNPKCRLLKLTSKGTRWQVFVSEAPSSPDLIFIQKLCVQIVNKPRSPRSKTIT
jgi:hypothetical protein